MKLWARHLALGLLLTAAMPPVVHAADSAEQILLAKANYWRLKERLDLARDALGKLLSVNPIQPDALYAYGVLELQLGNVAEARGYLARLRQAAPADPRVASLDGAVAAGPVSPAPAAGSSTPPPQAAGDLSTGAGSSSEPAPLDLTATSADSADVAPARGGAPAAKRVQLASLGPGAVSDGDLGPDLAPPSKGSKRTQLAQLELDVPGPVPIAAYGAPPPNPNAGNGPAPPQDSLQLDIERSIAQIEAENSPTLEGGFVYRGRFGTTGTSQLNEIAAPVDGTFSPWMTGKMTVSVAPVWLDSGAVGSSSLAQFGANETLSVASLPMVTPSDQSAFGALGSLAYAYGPFSGKIGESAWGFPVTNLIGNVAYSPKFLGGQMSVRLEAFREPVTDSLLSYAGTHANLGAANAITGNAFGNNGTWGGVTKSGLRGSVFYDDNDIGAFGIVSGGVLQGENVAQNSTVNAIIGGYFRPWRTDTQVVRVGVNLNYFHYDKDLSFYSFGQGGYFSPANYVALSFPVEYQGRADRWSWLAAVGLGVQHSNSDSSPFYPNNPAAQTALEIAAGSTSNSSVRYSGSHSTGLGFDVRGQVEYAMAKDLAVGASAQYDNGNSYNEGIFKLYVRKTFAEAAPVAPILPGTPSGGPPDNNNPAGGSPGNPSGTAY
jgi:tetratricopeptide (TPR) repeat protein